MESQIPLLALSFLGIGFIAYIYSSPKKKDLGSSFSQGKRIMIHNLLKTPLSSTLGVIPPGGHIMASPSRVLLSKWSVRGTVFLTLGHSFQKNLEEAIQRGHLYIGGVNGVYVYTDQIESLSSDSGPKELVISNLTSKVLRLDGIPPVLPFAEFTYRGSLGNGINLGSIFVDLDGVFEDYIMDKPITRLFYGAVSSQKPKRQINLTKLGMDVGESFDLMEPRGNLP